MDALIVLLRKYVILLNTMMEKFNQVIKPKNAKTITVKIIVGHLSLYKGFKMLVVMNKIIVNYLIVSVIL